MLEWIQLGWNSWKKPELANSADLEKAQIGHSILEVDNEQHMHLVLQQCVLP